MYGPEKWEPDAHRRLQNMEDRKTTAEKLAEVREAAGEGARELRREGFPVRDDCRIDSAAFSGEIFGEEQVARDLKLAESKRREFDRDSAEGKETGELLELASTLAFNTIWFRKRLVKVRASEFDDFVKGVDQLIIDRETFEIIAAADTTTAPDLKSPRLLEHIRQGMEVKYGVSLTAQGIKRQALTQLPYFIISIPAKDLSRLSEAAVSGAQTDFSKDLERKMLTQLIQETKVFEGAAGPAHRAPYARARKIFEEILADGASGRPN